MMRKYIIFLANFFLISGFASCESSDSDEKNGQTLCIQLSQDEITFTDGIATTKVFIEGFDRLAALEITKISGEERTTAKYKKSSLAQEYTFEYIITTSDAKVLVFEFVAVDIENKLSKTAKLTVNKNTVNDSKELDFSDLKCVSRVTGAEVNGANGL